MRTNRLLHVKYIVQVGVWGVILSCVSASQWCGAAWPSKPYATNDLPATQIRFATPAQADAKRQQLVDYIWSGGLPTSMMPSVTSNVEYPSTDLNGLNPQLISSVDKIDADVSELDFHSISYVLHPANTQNANRYVILHQGHVYSHDASFSAGLDNTANRLLQEGYTVVAVNMPLCGWNDDRTVKLPDGHDVTIPGTGSNGHCEMFDLLAPTLGNGAVFRLFLEPVVQDINYLKSTNANLQDISMIGLSGGGWTTVMLAAIDNRIKLSIPIAGSAPLYVQNRVSSADAEQVNAEMYDERINADGTGGGVATYLECYALGAFGPGRKQIMVTIPNEPTGLYPTAWITDSTIHAVAWGMDLDVANHTVNNLLTGVMDDLGQEQWQFAFDLSDNVHQISPWTIDNVIMPALQATHAPEPSVTALLTSGPCAWACLYGARCLHSRFLAQVAVRRRSQ